MEALASSLRPALDQTVASLAKPVIPRARPRPAPVRRELPAIDDDGRTAIYDITARTVYLPSGRRLEANSGPGRAAPRAGKPSAAPECQQRRNSESVTLWRLLGGRDFIRSRRSLV
jgi:hypothetical protein